MAMVLLGLKKLKLYAIYNVFKIQYKTMFYKLQKPQLPPDANLMTFEEFKILDKERHTIYVITIYFNGVIGTEEIKTLCYLQCYKIQYITMFYTLLVCNIIKNYYAGIEARSVLLLG